MKKQYIKPNIQIQNINFDNELMDNSLPMFNENSESIIEDESEILSNQTSVWSE